MSKPIIRIHDSETNEVIDREMTDEEYAQYQIDQEKYAEEEAVKAALEAKKQEVLAKLGLTSDEVAALLA